MKVLSTKNLFPSLFLILLNMSHQNFVNLDNEPTVVPARNFQRQVNLMVTKEVNLFAKKTSNPKRVSEVIENYLGTQGYQQTLIGRMWFMGRLLKLHVFPQEVQVIAKKIIYGHKWRGTEVNHRHVRIECRKII